MRPEIKEPVLQRTKETKTTVETKDALSEEPLYRRAIPKYVEHPIVEARVNAVSAMVDKSATKVVSGLNQTEEAASMTAVKGKRDYKNKKKQSQRHLSEEERNQKEIEEKVKAIDRGLVLQGTLDISINAKKSLFRRALDRTSEKIFKKLTPSQCDSLHDYTAAEAISQGRPYFTTINNVLRKGLYKENRDIKEIQAEQKALDKGFVYNEREMSQENFDAVTNCRAALKQSKLPRDMVFRRATNLESLSLMLGFKPQADMTATRAQILKNIARYNQGEDIVFDRGFLSTTPFSNAGFQNKEDQVEWMIQGHAGDHALYIANHSYFKHEGEMLFQSGTIFRILRICPPGTEEGQKFWKVYMETVHTDVKEE